MSLKFKAEDFMWSCGGHLNPIAAAKHANDMFAMWQEEFYKKCELFKPVRVIVPKGLAVVVEVSEEVVAVQKT